MENFNFHKPKTIEDAAKLLASSKDGKVLAGGQSLIPVMKLDLAKPSDLISLSAVPDLTKIFVLRDGGISIGALATHASVAESATVKGDIPALAHLAAMIGDAQVRNRGTIGGSIAHADPAADYPAAVVALNASIETNKGMHAADSFFTGMFETALAKGEIITQVRFKKPERAGYAKMPNPASKYALVGVFVAKFRDEVRVAVTGAATKVFRVEAMEKALAAKFAPESLDGIKVPADDLLEERDASASYRAHLVSVMAKRAVQSALGA